MTEEQLVLLRDKHTLWARASTEGAMDLRDYNRRAAEALGELLAEHSAGFPDAPQFGLIAEARRWISHAEAAARKPTSAPIPLVRRLADALAGLQDARQYCDLCALGFAPFKAEKIMWHQVNGRDPFRCTSTGAPDGR